MFYILITLITVIIEYKIIIKLYYFPIIIAIYVDISIIKNSNTKF